MIPFVLGFYIGGALVMGVMAPGPTRNRIGSALAWPTFPFWGLY